MQPGEDFMQLLLEYIAQNFVSVIVMCEGYSSTRSASRTSKDTNTVAINQGTEGFTSDEK
jgi:hypothetical protein